MSLDDKLVEVTEGGVYWEANPENTPHKVVFLDGEGAYYPPGSGLDASRH